MMWGVALVLLSCLRTAVMSGEYKMTCKDVGHSFPSYSNSSPSALGNLTVELVTVGGEEMLNISWAVHIDASIASLACTYLAISGQPPYCCEYEPHLKEDTTGAHQIWFHFLISASPGSYTIEAENWPLGPVMGGYVTRDVFIMVDQPQEDSKYLSNSRGTIQQANVTPIRTVSTPVALRGELVAAPIFGGLAFLMILTLCYLTYKCCGGNIVTSLGFESVPQSPTVPVRVLVVYPPVSPGFQRAVVALAEFLQWHGGCCVLIDMWQQQKIAELGPMRWLAEQVKSADQVLIICPKASPQPSHRGFPEASIPAAAHDLYPMILNLVAGHAKSTGELAKFWVVQFAGQHAKAPGAVPPELSACQCFCLTKELKKLWRSLHDRRPDNETCRVNFGSKMTFNEKATTKLKEAVEKHLQPSGTTEKCSHI